MSDYLVTDTELTSIANAIRAKSGGSSPLSFPAGFVSEIGNIPSGGGSVSVQLNDVNFYDYDGTVLYSYSKADFLQLASLPANPSHSGLTAQGWNWTLANAKTYVTTFGALDIGQSYITSDGTTRLYCEFEDGRLFTYLGLCVNGTVSINWGDGSAADTLTGTSLTIGSSQLHTYQKAGKYTITITVVSGSAAIYGVATTSMLFAKYSTSSSVAANTNNVYSRVLKKVEIGNNISLNKYAFYRCGSLQTISIPKTINFNGLESLFSDCKSLEFVVVPIATTSIPKYGFMNCTNLTRVILPEAVTTFESSCFSSCSGLRKILLPSGITSLPSGGFSSCGNIAKLTVPAGVTSIGSSCFSTCYGFGEVHFKSATPPTLSASNSLGLTSDCKIYVPTGKLSAYTSATNYPSSSTYTYIEE